MKRLFTALLLTLCVSIAAPAVAAGNASSSFRVSVTVLPPASERVDAPAPAAGLQPMKNAHGEHWIVEASAVDAVGDYTRQLEADGYQPINPSRTQWSNGTIGVMVSARDAISTKPISRLSVVAYDLKRQDQRIAARREQLAATASTSRMVASAP